MHAYCLILHMWSSRTGKTNLWWYQPEQWLPLGVEGSTGTGHKAAFWMVQYLHWVTWVYAFVKLNEFYT